MSNKGSVADSHIGCPGSVGSICHICGIHNLGGCAHALARLGPIQSLIAIGSDICGSNNVETRVDFGDEHLRQVIFPAPPPHILKF